MRSIWDLEIPSYLEDIVKFQDMFSRPPSEENIPIIESDGEIIYYISVLVRIRPFELERIAKICLEYGKRGEKFQSALIKMLSYDNMRLVYELFLAGFCDFGIILGYLRHYRNFYSHLYFFKENPSFLGKIQKLHSKVKYQDSFFQKYSKELITNERTRDEYINYGAQKNSIEYALKYDEIEILHNSSANPDFDIQGVIEWSPFEWSLKPDDLNYLSVSAHFGSINCFKALLMKGSIVNQKVFFCSLHSGNFDIVHICERFCKIEPIEAIRIASDYWNSDLFDYFASQKTLREPAQSHSFVRCLLFFLALGVRIETFHRFNTPILYSIMAYNRHSLMRLILEKGQCINKACCLDLSPLNFAVIMKDHIAVDYIISHGVDLKLEINNTCVINSALATKDKALINKIIHLYKTFNTPDKTFLYPLHIAAKNNDIEMVSFLLSKGAKVDVKGPRCKTPIDYSVPSGNLELLRLLLGKLGQRKSDLSLVNSLMLAVKHCYLHIIEYLLTKGVDINAHNKTGNNALHIAAKKGNLDLIQYLISKGVNINSKNDTGCTPLMLAVFSKNFIIAKYLIDQGADPEINYKGISTKNLAFKSAFVTFLNQHH